jgi:hypothetical protein
LRSIRRILCAFLANAFDCRFEPLYLIGLPRAAQRRNTDPLRTYGQSPTVLAIARRCGAREISLFAHRAHRYRPRLGVSGTSGSNLLSSSRESRRLPDSDRQKWPKPERGRPNAISRGTHRCTAAEVWAGRPQRLAQRRDGSANPVQAAARGDLWVWAGAACAGTHFGGPSPQPGAKRLDRAACRRQSALPLSPHNCPSVRRTNRCVSALSAAAVTAPDLSVRPA